MEVKMGKLLNESNALSSVKFTEMMVVMFLLEIHDLK